MSILDNNLEINRPSPAKLAANRLIQTTRQTYQQMVSSYNTGAQLFWNNNNASPEAIAQELGTNAKEVFELHYKLGQLLNTIKPESITTGTSAIGNFTLNQDGTVTIN